MMRERLWKREYSSHFMNERRREHSYLSIDTHPEDGAMRYSRDLLRTGLGEGQSS